ncbi:MAG: hypothetical protein WA461_06055 [Nitrososphaeraceae archaeon]
MTSLSRSQKFSFIKIDWGANELTTIIKDTLKTGSCVTITITEIRLIQLQIEKVIKNGKKNAVVKVI